MAEKINLIDDFAIRKKQIDNQVEYEITSAKQLEKIKSALRESAEYKKKQRSVQVAEDISREEAELARKNHRLQLDQLKELYNTKLQTIQNEKLSSKEAAKAAANAQQEYEATLKKLKLQYASEVDKRLHAQETAREKFNDSMERKAFELAIRYDTETQKRTNIYEQQRIQNAKVAALERAKILAKETADRKAADNEVEKARLKNLVENGKTERSRNSASAKLSKLQEDEKSLRDDEFKLSAEYIEAKSTASNLAKKVRSAKLSILGSQGTASDQFSFLRGEASNLESERQSNLTEIARVQADISSSGNDTDRIDKLNSYLQSLIESNSELVKTQTELTKQEKDAAKAASLEAKKKTLTELKSSSPKTIEEQKLDREIQKQEVRNKAQEDQSLFLSKTGVQDNLGKALANSLEKLGSALNGALTQIDSNITSFYGYQAQMIARLEGSNNDYTKMLSDVSTTVKINGYISQKKVIENLNKLVEAGIADDLELRAFVATVSDRVASTFDAFDSNLLRLIRIQNADSTTARLGLESNLKSLFNTYFSDSSYLSDVFDQVSSSLLDANAQLGNEESTSFEYVVQKWLGSLYSVGFSSSTITQIAQGLDYLSTGNVSALNSNESLQALLAMSASKANLPYGDILNNGLSATDANKLFVGMLNYLQTIAENTDTKVTKAAYGNVFGLSTTDLKAVTNLVNTIGGNESFVNDILTYNQAIDAAQLGINNITGNTHLSTVIDTMVENALTSASVGLGGDAAGYATWKVLNIIEDLTGGIPIPGVSVFGNMVDLHQTVTGLAKSGLAGVGLMSTLLGDVFSGQTGNPLDLSNWNNGNTLQTARGELLAASLGGVNKSLSQSSGIFDNSSLSVNSEDINNANLNKAAQDAEDDSKILNQNTEESLDIYEKIYNTVTAGFESVEQLLAPSRVFYSLVSGALSSSTSMFDTANGMLSMRDPASKLVSSIVSSTNTVDTDRIVNLMNSYSLSGVAASAITSTSNNGSADLATMLKTIIADLQTQNATEIGAAISSALTGSVSSSGEASMPLIDQLKELLTDTMGVTVRVTNDNFDTVLSNLTRP